MTDELTFIASLGPGSMPAVVTRPLALMIAAAGIDHWSAGTGILESRNFLNGVLSVMNNGTKEREFLASSPAGISNPRWVEVVYRTCMHATHGGRLEGVDPDIFPFAQIDTFACKRKHGAMDHFTAKARDPIWQSLIPPFDWLCGCAVMPLLDMDVRDKRQARVSGLSRFNLERLQAIRTWTQRSPEEAIRRL